MNDNNCREERVRQQAYFIWLSEGRPEGRDKEHWDEAERTVSRLDELAQEDESGGVAATGAPLGPGQA